MGHMAKNLLEPIGPEGRLRVLNALMKEHGVKDELPYICPETGHPTTAAETYYECLKTLIDYAMNA